MYYIYALRNKKDEVVYVGRTNNVKRRISEHKRNKDFDYHQVLEECFDLEKAKKIEDFFIMRFDPKYNKSLNSGGMYISIKEETRDKKYDIARLLELINSYEVRPIFNDKYQDFTIIHILNECEVE